MRKQTINSTLSRWALIAAITAATAGCAGGPLTAREQGAGIGALDVSNSDAGLSALVGGLARPIGKEDASF